MKTWVCSTYLHMLLHRSRLFVKTSVALVFVHGLPSKRSLICPCAILFLLRIVYSTWNIKSNSLTCTDFWCKRALWFWKHFSYVAKPIGLRLCRDDYACFSDTSCMRAFTVPVERRCVDSEHNPKTLNPKHCLFHVMHRKASSTYILVNII